MEKKIPMLTFNVDLNSDVFRAVADKFLEYIVGSPNAETNDVDTFYEVIEPETSHVHVAVFFARSLEVSSQEMIATEKKLFDIFDSLLERQSNLTIGAIILVDCGEVGMLPMSQFVTIQNMIECISNFVSDTADRRVFVIDCEENAQSGDGIHVYDTTTFAFKDRLWAYFESSLSSLNQRFGAVALPKF